MNLPELPKNLSWSITPYTGNGEDGVYQDGQRVLVGIRQAGKFLFWNTNFLMTGVIARIADPRKGEAEVQLAVDDVYDSYLAHIRGLAVTAAVTTKNN